MKKTGKGRKPPLPPIVLPNVLCRKCGIEHPDRLMLNTQETAGYLRHTVPSIYSKKSRRELPPCVPGRDSPFWMPCDLARYLFPRSDSILRELLATLKSEASKASGDEKANIEFEIEKTEFELRRSMELKKG